MTDNSAYQQLEERLRDIQDWISEGYYEIDLKGNLTFVNNAFKKILYPDRSAWDIRAGPRTEDLLIAMPIPMWRDLLLLSTTVLSRIIFQSSKNSWPGVVPLLRKPTAK